MQISGGKLLAGTTIGGHERFRRLRKLAPAVIVAEAKSWKEGEFTFRGYERGGGGGAGSTHINISLRKRATEGG